MTGRIPGKAQPQHAKCWTGRSAIVQIPMDSGNFLSVPTATATKWAGKDRVKRSGPDSSKTLLSLLPRKENAGSVDSSEQMTSGYEADESTASKSDDNVDNAPAGSYVSVLHAENGGAEKPLLKQRAQWDNKTQFVLSLISYAVGLGNIWRFPYLCQENGGGAFLIPYTISMIVLGIPLFYLEIGVGQKFRCGPIGVWHRVHPRLAGVGISSAVVSFLIGLYYNVIIAWCLFYLLHSFQGPLPWAACPLDKNNTEILECQLSSETSYFWYREAVKSTERIDQLGGINWKMAVSLVACWVVVFLCVMKGIKSSGKVMCFTAVFPYIVLTIFFVRALLLDGAMLGLKHMFTPDFQKLLEPKVWLDGATQVFFSFGLGFGGLIAFASYNDPKNDCRRDTLIVSFANWFTALYAAVVIYAVIGFKATLKHAKCINRNLDHITATYPAIFNYTKPDMAQLEKSSYWQLIQGHINATEIIERPGTTALSLATCDLNQELNQAAGGTGLAFITFTQAMVEFPGAPFWAALFFLMLLSLGLGSMFGTLEGVISSLIDWRGTERIRKEIIIACICLVSLAIGILFVTNAGHYWVQLFDTYSGSFALMIVTLFEVTAISYVYGWRRFCGDLKSMTGHAPSLYWRWSWRFVAPLIMAVIFGSSVIDSFLQRPSYQAYNQAKAKTETVPLPTCAVVVASMIVVITVLPIPCVAFLDILREQLAKFRRVPRRGPGLAHVAAQSTITIAPISRLDSHYTDSGRGSLEDAIAKM